MAVGTYSSKNLWQQNAVHMADREEKQGTRLLVCLSPVMSQPETKTLGWHHSPFRARCFLHSQSFLEVISQTFPKLCLLGDSKWKPLVDED